MTTKIAAKISKDGFEMPYTVNPRWITSPMTVPSETVAALA